MSTPIAQLAREHARLLDGSRAAMTIAGADLTSGFFAGVAWHNLRFVDCDFAGEGNVRLDAMSDCRFMDCRFIAPSHDFGVMDDVRFVRCRTSGAAILGGRDASFGVVFEECVFAGGDTVSHAREGIGSSGETTIRRCTGRGAVLVAGTRLAIEGCSFEHMSFTIGRQRDRGVPLAATVAIENTQGTGVWRMTDARMKTCHIRNSRFERIVDDGSECEP